MNRILLIGLACVPLFAQTPVNCDDHGDMHMDCGVPSNVHRQTGSPLKADVLPPRPSAQTPNHVFVGQRAYDANRSGANTHETVLTPANVHGLHRVFTHALPGDARGMEAQPLIVPHVKLASGETYSLAIYATMANDIYAYDADSPQLLWAVQLGHPVTGSRQIDGWSINQNWGIIGTPVIDPETSRLYVVTWSDPNGNWQTAVHTMRVVDLASGREVASCSFEGVTYNPGNGLPIQTFSGSERKQRASLAFANVGGHKTVFVPLGTIWELDRLNRGWMLAYDVATNSIAAAWTSAVRFGGGGIWQAGQAPAVRTNADGTASLYFMTGNGPFDAVSEWGESFIRLDYAPAKGFHVADWWTPYSDTGRVGQDQAQVNITKVLNCCGTDDIDLGSGGATLVGKFLLGAGKDGIGYMLDSANMGKTRPADFTDPSGNYAKAKWIGWFSFPSAMDVAQFGAIGTPTPQKFVDLNRWSLYGRKTHHVHGTPVWFVDELGDVKTYVMGENGNLRCFHVDKATGVLTFLANGSEVASPNSPTPPGGMPGGMLSISANGTQNVILWATVPDGDANKTVTSGRVYAYDANNLNATYSDGTRKIPLLWTSPTYIYNKFDTAVVSGGKLYVPNYSGGVDVYGLQ